MHRRHAITVLVSAVASPILLKTRGWPCIVAPVDFAVIERSVGGRLGVAAFDAAGSRRLTYRADERFPMCSTFKWLLAAQVLSRIEAGEENLFRDLPYGPADLLEYAPVTREHVTEGSMKVADLAAAAVQVSDNTAGNLLLRANGGPASFTAYLRAIGDHVSRLDRTEPELNSAEPGDVRDTTTPRAMLGNMERLLLGNQLRVASRKRLLDWLVASTTGAKRLRAGLPADWQVGNKTGTGGHGATGDVAIAWPPDRRPVLVAAYVADSAATMQVREAALATIARSIAAWAAGNE
jgi:beta-lactamase class A